MARFTVTNTNDSGAGSLRQAITSADASTGKNIINFCGLFDDGLAHTISLTGGGLSITDDITILGRNPNLLTISENSASRVFDITSGATATINGLTIINSYNAVGGGGGISNEGVLTLNNSIITGNTVTNNVTDIIFKSNFGEGGGIYNSGNLIVNHSIISNNSATGVRAGNLEFAGYDSGEGGGIYNSGSLIVNYSTINNCQVTSDDYQGQGGGIYSSGNTIINHSAIISNNSAGDGGGIYDDHAAKNKGGGINDDLGSLTVNYSTISDNSAAYEGGGISVFALGSLNSFTVNYSNIIGNTAGRIGGGICSRAPEKLNVNYSNISDNSADDGGGIYSFDGAVSVSNSIISGNSAVGRSTPLYKGFGGGINAYFYSVSNSIISGNSALVEGGGIYEKGNGSVSNSIISGNSAVKGGGIYIAFTGTTSNITVSNSTVSGNTALEGGGIYNFGDLYLRSLDRYTRYVESSYGILTIVNSSITDNNATTGGGIYNNGSLSVNDSTIINNYATKYGGGIYNSSSNAGTYTTAPSSQTRLGLVTVSYSSISDNTAGIAGGGIYNNADDGGDYTGTVTGNQLGVVTVSDSTLSGNQAHFGAGIYNDGTLTVGNSTIKHNKAFGIELSSGSYEFGDGGGIYNNSTYGTTTVDYSAIACNFDTYQEDSNNRIQPDDIAGKFINNGYNWIGINTATTAAGDVA